MDPRYLTDKYYDIYQKISIVDPNTITNSELNLFVEQLQVLSLTGTIDEIIDTLTEMSRREYLYYWSLELDPLTSTSDDIQSLATSLDINEITGDINLIIEHLRTKALDLKTKQPLPVYSPKISTCPVPVSHVEEQQNIDQIMVDAAVSGDIDLVTQMLNRGALEIDIALDETAHWGHENIARLLSERGATDFDTPMISAAQAGHENIVKLMLDKGAEEFIKAMQEAAINRHKNIVSLILTQKGDDIDEDDIDSAIESIVMYDGDTENAQLLLDWKKLRFGSTTS